MIIDTGASLSSSTPATAPRASCRARRAAGWRRSLPFRHHAGADRVVVLSHGHPDHVGGVMENGKPLFSNARYVIGAIEYDFWSPTGKFTGEVEKLASLFRADVVPLAEKITFLKPGDDVVPGIRAREA